MADLSVLRRWLSRLSESSVPPCWVSYFLPVAEKVSKNACPIILPFAALRVPSAFASCVALPPASIQSSFRCCSEGRHEGPSLARRSLLGIHASQPSTQHLRSAYSRGDWVHSASFVGRTRRRQYAANRCVTRMAGCRCAPRPPYKKQDAACLHGPTVPSGG